jgi:mRNA interferase RelE/StbE
VGAVVPVEVADHVEELEDAYWSSRAAAVLAKGEPTVAWDAAVAELEADEDTDRDLSDRDHPGALRALGKLDKPVRRRVQTAIDRLQHDPRPNGVVALQGLQTAYRVRVGDYRMVYTVHDDQLLVVVIDLGHRREIYRSLICHAEADPNRRPAHHR